MYLGRADLVSWQQVPILVCSNMKTIPFFNVLFSAKNNFQFKTSCFQQKQPPDSPVLSKKTHLNSYSNLFSARTTSCFTGWSRTPSQNCPTPWLQGSAPPSQPPKFRISPFSCLPQVQDLFKYHLGITRSIPTKKVGA